MAVFRRGDKWAVTVHDPTTGSKRWVGTYTHHRDAKDAEGTARLRHGIPPDFAGRTVLFQAVERSTCRVSNRVATNFQ